MLKIKAEVRYIPRVKVAVPMDGVHVAGKDGAIKGVHSLWFDVKLVPKGATSAYFRVNEDEGLRIGYSFSWFKALSESVVLRDHEYMVRAYKANVAPQPMGITEVKLSLNYHENDKPVKKIHTLAYAIKVKHVHYPEQAWLDYAKGYPYDWKAVDHPDHNPEGFLAFRETVRPVIAKLGLDTSLKLGDILFCTKLGRWFLVDCGK
jgi:hypothetical protein